MSRFFRVRILAGDNAVELLNINGMSDTVEWVSKIAEAVPGLNVEITTSLGGGEVSPKNLTDLALELGNYILFGIPAKFIEIPDGDIKQARAVTIEAATSGAQSPLPTGDYAQPPDVPEPTHLDSGTIVLSTTTP